MKIGDKLYFAPGITFSQLDLSGEKLPSQLNKRINFFFLEPAGLLLKKDFSFAAGVLLVSCIDFLAKICYPNEGVGIRIQKWCPKHLPSISSDISELFSDHFRNGLVHEARIKCGGEFSLETQSTVERFGRSLRINPRLLHEEVKNAFRNYLEDLKANESSRQVLINWIQENFKYELDN